MKKVLMIAALSLTLVACGSGVKEKELIAKYQLTPATAVHWDKAIMHIIPAEAKVSDWYGNENPITYLQKTGRMNEKDFYFFKELSAKRPEHVTEEEFDKFVDLLTDYVNALPRQFKLGETNIKDPKGLVTLMVRESNSPVDNPSRYIKDYIADPKDWQLIEEYAKKPDLKEKEVRKLRKILNSFLKDPDFFREEIWYRREVSDRMLELVNLSKVSNPTKMERNNVNAKALYLAYPEYFSKLDKWDK